MAAMTGCASMEDIDQRVDRLLASRSATLAGDSIQPDRAPVLPDRLDDRSINAFDPGTTNPEAASLDYRPLARDEADEASEVAERLDRFFAEDAEAQSLDLEGVFRQAQATSREYRTAEEEYILEAINVLIERHLWGPRFFDDLSVSFDGSQTDGDVSSAISVVNDLRVTQRLPYGGDVEARLLWQAAQDLRSATTDQYEQSASLILSGNIPLLRGAGPVNYESRIQAERDLVYAARDFERFRREFLVDLARDYFALLRQRQQIANAALRVERLKDVVRRQQALFDAGRVSEFQVLIARTGVLQGQADVANLRDSFALSIDRFKIRLGMPVTDPLELIPVALYVPQPSDERAEAVDAALDFRLDLQNQRDFVEDSRRSVRNARNDILPDLDIAADVTFGTDPDEDEGGLVFEPDDASYGASVTFGLPLDREVERLELRSSLIRFEQRKRAFEQFRDNVVLDAIAALRQIPLQQYNLLLAEQAVRENERRQIEQKIKEAEITPQDLLDTEDALLDARNRRDQAEEALQNAVLDYLLTTGQMRVSPTGQFLALPGMGDAGFRMVEPSERDPAYPETEEEGRERLEAVEEPLDPLPDPQP